MTQHIAKPRLNEILEIFKLFDHNNDGSLSASELGEAMRALKQNPTEKEIQNLVKTLDLNANGKIDLKEFAVMMDKKMTYKQPETDLNRAFKVFDRDGNGYIDKDELKHVLSSMGDKLTDAEVQEILEDADLDKDGVIDYKEFVEIMVGKTEPQKF